MMTKINSVILTLVLLSVGLFTPGCVTGPDGTPTITQTDLDNAAVVLRTAARGAAVFAIEDDKDNAQYIRLSVTILDTFITGDAYKPSELADALEPVLKQAQDPKVKLAINTAIDLYEIFLDRYVRGEFSKQAVAKQFVTALRDGAASAL